MPTVECSHRPPCPGCPRLGAPGPPPRALDAIAAFGRERGVEAAAPVVGAAEGFRTRARLAVRGRARSPKIGLFQRDSHRIVDTPRCRIHHPLINRVASALRDAVRETGIAPYADASHRGELRYLQVSVLDEAVDERGDGAIADDAPLDPSDPTRARAQVVLVGRGDDPAPLAALVEPLTHALGDALHSLFWNGQPARDNAILGPSWHRWHGPVASMERHEEASVFTPPGAFRQSHGALARALAHRARSWVPAGQRVTEYFAGCGVIGLPLLARGHRVVFNERDGEGLRGLALGLAALPTEVAARARVLPGAAEDAIQALAESDCVILDPPRRGAGDALIDALRRAPVERVVYLSCGLHSFLREAEALTRAGGFALAALEPFDLFPYTEHVETAALFVRA